MKIEITQVTPWSRALAAARWTVNKQDINKEPSDKWKAEMLMAEHSPIRLVEYDIKMYDIPNKVMGHIVRHHEGCEKFVGTHRSDRVDANDLQVNRMTPTMLWFTANAQALINVSRQRLCNMAEKDTRDIWNMVKDEMQKVDPVMAGAMVRNCIYRGHCPEMRPCKYTTTQTYRNEVCSYRNLRLAY